MNKTKEELLNDIVLISTDEAAEKLEVTRRSIYRFIKQGRLNAVKVGREWKITLESLRNFLGLS